MKVRRLFTMKRRVAAAVMGGALVVGAAGVAFAVFTAHGTGPGAATVATAPGGLTVLGTRLTPATGKLYPPSTPGTGASTLVLVYKVTNHTGHGQTITTTKAKGTIVSTTGGLIETATDSTAAVTGCKASWFGVTSVTFGAGYLATGASTTAFVTVSMPYNSHTQNACSGARPKVTLTVPSHS